MAGDGGIRVAECDHASSGKDGMSTWSMNVAADFGLSAGIIHVGNAAASRDLLFNGLKIVVILSGGLRCQIEGQAETEISGPSLCTILNTEVPRYGDQTFLPGKVLRYAILEVGYDMLLHGLEVEPNDIAVAARGGAHSQTAFHCQPASAVLRTLCRQILLCPLHGVARKLYLAGKGLELAGHAVVQMGADQQAANPHSITSIDRDRIHAAKRLLQSQIHDPPSLDQLGRAVGLHPRKLTRLFRKVHGVSVHAYLQQQRLEEAYRMIADGEMSISAAAYHVGYSPAHFSVAFRKRFGIAPRDLHG